MRRHLVIALTAALLTSPAAALAQPVGATASSPTFDPATAYGVPGRLVKVDGERALNLVCFGSGSPTVILESGAGSGAVAWRNVHGELSRTTRTCAYDRAGYGFSDPSPRPADAENTIDDLHRLIRSARITEPVVLVGHSAGGLYVQMFATDHPELVAGVVLVDASVRDEARMVWEVLTEEERDRARRGFAAMNAHFANCIAQARSGALRSPEVKECRPPRTGIAPLDDELRRQFNEPKHHEAVLSEMTNFSPTDATGKGSVTMAQAMAKPFRLGTKPLIVLSASHDRVPAGEAGQRLREMAGAEQQRVVAASTMGRLVRVSNSGHMMQDDQPLAVIAAVLEVVQHARGQDSQPR